jgi:hypothetical protein
VFYLQVAAYNLKCSSLYWAICTCLKAYEHPIDSQKHSLLCPRIRR